MHKTTKSRLVVPPSIICISPLSFRAHSVAKAIPVSVDRLAAPADPDRWGSILPRSLPAGADGCLGSVGPLSYRKGSQRASGQAEPRGEARQHVSSASISTGADWSDSIKSTPLPDSLPREHRVFSDRRAVGDFGFVDGPFARENPAVRDAVGAGYPLQPRNSQNPGSGSESWSRIEPGAVTGAAYCSRLQGRSCK